jgi:hypothetical protein
MERDTPLSGYDQLQTLPDIALQPENFDYTANPAYEKYLLIHKVLVGNRGAQQLEGIYHALKDEFMPRYLSAAGWAAAESAMVRTDMPVRDRLTLLDGAVETWRTALDHQQWLNAVEPDERIEHSAPHRIALDIAVAPLLAGIVTGGISKADRKRAFVDCLNIAESNAVYIDLMAKNKNRYGLADHLGFGYECNALLSFNRGLTRTWFAIPSMNRSDTGYRYRHQTHDLLAIHLQGGKLESATPIEIKSKASLRDRQRYDALLVRGKMHLSTEGKHAPKYTLAAIAAVYGGRPTREERNIVDNASERILAMVRDYRAGRKIGDLATKHMVTVFRDDALVVARHPGLSKVAVA